MGSNSPLVEVTRFTVNCNKPRNHVIDKITWHHAAGVIKCESFFNMTCDPNREVSAQYIVDCNARVGLNVNEWDRAWTSSSPSNDNRAVTLEISNCAVGGDWPISDKVMNKAIELTVDICKRNNIKELVYTGDERGNFTFHRFFTATSCPGPYIFNRANEIVARINALLKGGSQVETPVLVPNTGDIKAGDVVSISAGATYYNGRGIPEFVMNDKWYVTQVTGGNRAVLGKNVSGTRDIQSPISTRFLSSNTKAVEATQPVINNNNGVVSVGSLIKLSDNAVYYNGASIPSWVKGTKWNVCQVNGDRIVLGKDISGKYDIQSAVSKQYVVSDDIQVPKSTSYTKALRASDVIYRNTSGNEVAGTVGKDGVYTIVEEVCDNGVTYGKLKSGAGYVVLSGARPNTEIKVGDRVKVLSNKQYNGNTFAVYCDTYYVLERDGDRIVISSDNKNVTAAVNVNNLQKL